MKVKAIRSCLEVLSFILWMVFTIFAFAVAGLSLEGILFGAFMVMASSSQPVHLPLTMAGVGVLGVFFSLLWRQVGVDYFHYLQYDSPKFMGEDEGTPSHVLLGLIREVEASAGVARSDARAKAKTWLLRHASALDEVDILLAKAHFGYLLPAGWAILVRKKVEV